MRGFSPPSCAGGAGLQPAGRAGALARLRFSRRRVTAHQSDLAEYLLATGCLELGRRAGEVLRLRRDAGIAVNHAPILEQNLGTKKRNLFSGLSLFQKS